jgi:hypothetical protein
MAEERDGELRLVELEQDLRCLQARDHVHVARRVAERGARERVVRLLRLVLHPETEGDERTGPREELGFAEELRGGVEVREAEHARKERVRVLREAQEEQPQPEAVAERRKLNERTVRPCRLPAPARKHEVVNAPQRGLEVVALKVRDDLPQRLRDR